MLYPDYYCKNVKSISLKFLNENNIKGLILDVDNTLIDIDRKILEGAKEWHQSMVDGGIKTIILSNTNKVDKAKTVADTLKTEFINFARKPSKKGFMQAKEKLDLPVENIAAIGDQIFTDVIGANRCNMFSILVEPVDERDFWYTKWKRPFENWIIKNYLKKKEK